MKVLLTKHIPMAIGLLVFPVILFIAWRIFDGYRHGWVYTYTCLQIAIDSGKIARSESTADVARLIVESGASKAPLAPQHTMVVHSSDYFVTWFGPSNPLLTICKTGDYQAWENAVRFFEQKLAESFAITNIRLQLDPSEYVSVSPVNFDLARPIDFQYLRKTMLIK